MRSRLLSLLTAVCLSHANAGEQYQYIVANAAVFVSDSSVVDVQLSPGQFAFSPAERDPYWNERSKRRYVAHSKRYAEAQLRFTGQLLSPSTDKVPTLDSITVQWSVKGVEDAKFEAVVPLRQYGTIHNFLNAALLVTVQPSGLVVELLEDRENKAKQFFRCLGSSSSATGTCTPRYDLVPLGSVPAKSTPVAAASATR